MIRAVIFLSLLYLSDTVIADGCPPAQIVKDRKISRDYEWTLDERKTLDDVLAVERLYSVRIKNKGEFVACYYSGKTGLLRLDAKPEKEGCIIAIKTGEWTALDTGEALCVEDNLQLCHYEISCKE